MPLRRWLLGFSIILSTTAAFAAGLTDEERAQLWRDARAQLLAHPRLVYHNGETVLPEYPGYITSNEMAHWTMQPPPGRGDLLLGFGTTINFNLIATRQNQAFLNADQSEEVLVAMMSFWRPLFLVSKSPEEWLANVAGMETSPEDTVQSLFKRFHEGELGSEKGIAALEAKLEALVREGRITAFDKRFTLAVVRDQVTPPEPRPSVQTFLDAFALGRQLPVAKTVPVFRNARESLRIPAQLANLYYRPSQDRALTQLAIQTGATIPHIDTLATFTARQRDEAMRRVSFLTTGGYRNVRDFYGTQQDFYAQTQIQDPKFWRRAAKFAEKKGARLTDFYMTNIPAGVKPDIADFDAVLGRELKTIPHTRTIATYESHGAQPHIFETQLYEPEKPYFSRVTNWQTSSRFVTGCFSTFQALAPAQ